MTRAQRRIRNEKARAASAGLSTRFAGHFAAGIHIAENPNSRTRVKPGWHVQRPGSQL